MSKPFRIGIAGLGTVGAGVVSILQDNAALIATRAGRPIEIVSVSARNRQKKRGVDLKKYQWLEKPENIADTDIDAVVELIGGADGAAKKLVEKALDKRRHVVTANKALLAKHGLALAQRAEKSNVSLNYEASVAGGIPIIKALREGFGANKIQAVYGILNGTCNYILTEMRETGRSFSDVLKDAQAKGYAEADPTFDVDGIDSAHKLCILTSLAFGVKPDVKALKATGIRSISAIDIDLAKDLGYKIKLLGIAKNYNGKIMQVVEPCLVPAQSGLGAVEGVFNAVYVQGDSVGSQLLTGRGAGAGPTASSVVADIIDLARGQKIPVFGIPAAKLKDAQNLDRGSIESRYYMRLNVLDVPGVIAEVGAILRDHNVSVESLVQRGRDIKKPVSVVIITHDAKHRDMIESCRLIHKLKFTREPPCLIRIEEL